MLKYLSTVLMILAFADSASAQILQVRYFGTVISVDDELTAEFSVGESVELFQSFDTDGGFDVFGASTSLDATRFNSIDSGFLFGGDYSASNTTGAPYAEFHDLESGAYYFPNTGQGATFSTNFFGNRPPDVAGASWQQIFTYMEVPAGSFSSVNDPEDVISASEILALNGAALIPSDGSLSFDLNGVTRRVEFEITRMAVTDLTSPLVVSLDYIDSAQRLGFEAGFTADVATGDLDGDGDNDAITVHGGSRDDFGIKTWLNDGSGLLTLGQELDAGEFRNDVLLGDMDLDGDLDAVVSYSGTGKISLWLNNGIGGFTPAGLIFDSGFGIGALVLVDSDGDTDLDVVATNLNEDAATGERLTVTVVLENTAVGSAQFIQTQTIGEFANNIGAGDFNGDGFDDILLICNCITRTVILTNDGSGAFYPDTYDFGEENHTAGAVDDLNGDARPDIVLYENNRVAIRLNDGQGGFTNGDAYLGVSGPFDIILNDLDNDGDVDLVVTGASGTIDILANNGDGTFERATEFSTEDSNWPYSAGVSDFSGDGIPDIFVGISFGTDEVWFNRGLPTESSDIDGDSIPDESDNCPAIANADQLDTDSDGLGNVCDDDDDGDGVNDSDDVDPLDPTIPGDSTTKPDTPEILSPSGDIVTAIPAYEWQYGGNVQTYRVRVYDRSKAEWVYDQQLNAVDVCDASLCSISPAIALVFGRRHQVRVAARNVAGWSGWAMSVFNYLPALPASPTLITPLAQVDVANPAFQWQADSNTSEYRLRVYDRVKRTWVFDKWLQAADVCDATACTAMPDIELDFSRRHQWRVAARNLAGFSAWSFQVFDYLPDPPATPTLIGPEGAIDTASPTFQWQADNTATEYRLRIYDRSTRTWIYDERLPAVDVCDAALCSIKPDIALGFSQRHQWRVAVRNAAGWSAWGHSIFSYLPDPPTAPDLISPQGAIGTPSPIFQWQADSNVLEYRIRVYDRAKATWVVDQRVMAASVCSAEDCSMDPGVTLDASRNHQWRVAARNAAGWSTWSVLVFDYLE